MRTHLVLGVEVLHWMALVTTLGTTIGVALAAVCHRCEARVSAGIEGFQAKRDRFYDELL
jgi:hypothetical protein